MKKTIIYLILLVFSSDVFSQIQSDCNVPSILFTEYESDVRDLALKRILSLECVDTAQIIIPSSYQDTIWHGLASIFNISSLPERDSVFDIYCVHNNSTSNTVIYKDIYVQVDDSYGWTSAWTSLTTITGYTDLDKLLSSYGFSIVHYSSLIDVAKLRTDQEINVYALCDSIELLDGIILAEPSVEPGDENRISYDRSGDSLFYNFTVGWGDCNSLCGNKYTWKFQVNYSDCSVEYIGVDFYNGMPSDPFPEPSDCNITLQRNIVENNSLINLFPNPFAYSINIETPKEGLLEIHSLDGRLLYSAFINKGKQELNLSKLPVGFYIAKLIIDSDIYVERILKSL